MKITESLIVEATKEEVWSIFMDVEKLAGCVPGCKSMQALSEMEYQADMEVKTKFMTISFQANGRLTNFIEGEELNIVMTGKPLRLAGLFKTNVKVRLIEMDPEKTKVVYDMDLQMTGRLASLGDVLMKGTIVQSSREFAENLRRLVSAGQ